MSIFFWSFSALFGFSQVDPFEPLQLFRPTPDHSNLEVVPETLNLLKEEKGGKISILAVVGPYHSGKSFLLNSLSKKTKLFDVGKNVTPETFGIWICKTKMRSLKDDSEIWLLDSEGFYGPNVSRDYDARVFTISSILSSHLIYNTVKIIDASQVELIESLTKRTQLFKSKTDPVEEGAVPLFLKQEAFPPVTWVVEDFVQVHDSKSADGWVALYLDDKGPGKESYLKRVFKEIKTHTLYLPITNFESLGDLSKVPYENLSVEFRGQLEKLKENILGQISAKVTYLEKEKEKFLTSQSLADICYFLSSNLKEGGNYPALPDIWSSWNLKILENSLADSQKLFIKKTQNLIDRKSLIDPNSVVLSICSARSKAINFYVTLVREFTDRIETEILEEWIGKESKKIIKKYSRTIKNFLKEKHENFVGQFREAVSAFLKGNFPTDPNVLKEKLNAEKEKRTNEMAKFYETFSTWSFLNCCKNRPKVGLLENDREDFVRNLEVKLTDWSTDFVENNKKKIDEILEKALGEVSRFTDGQISSYQNKLLGDHQFSLEAKNVLKNSLEKFHEECLKLAASSENNSTAASVRFITELSKFKSLNNSLMSEVNLKLDKLRISKDAFILEFLNKESENLLREFKNQSRIAEVRGLPCDNNHLRSGHDQRVAEVLKHIEQNWGAIKDAKFYKDANKKLLQLFESEWQRLHAKNIELWKVHSDEAFKCTVAELAIYEEQNCPYGLCRFKILPNFHKKITKEFYDQCFPSHNLANMSKEIKNDVFESWYQKDFQNVSSSSFFSNAILTILAILLPFLAFFLRRKSKEIRAMIFGPKMPPPGNFGGRRVSTRNPEDENLFNFTENFLSESFGDKSQLRAGGSLGYPGGDHLNTTENAQMGGSFFDNDENVFNLRGENRSTLKIATDNVVSEALKSEKNTL